MDSSLPAARSCAYCAAEMPSDSVYCPGCGRPQPATSDSAPSQPRAQGKVGLLPESLAGAIAYFTFIPAILFLSLEPYKRSRFVRFHSIQCLIVSLCALVLGLVLKIAGMVFFLVPVVGPLLVTLLSVTVSLAAVLIWLVLVVKALQGEMFRLPILGHLAQQYAA